MMSKNAAIRFHDSIQRILFRVSLFWHCHQRPDRSFIINGRQMPLCARCIGILFGLLLAPVFLLLPSHFWCLKFACFLMPVDSLTQAVGWRASNNSLRLFTGLLFPISIIMWFL